MMPTPTDDSDAEMLAFTARLRSEIMPWIEQSTIPFFHVRRNMLTNEHEIADKDRSGVFLRIGDDHFLLTAAHLIADYPDEQIYMYMSWDDDDKDSIQIPVEQFSLTPEDSLDVAALKLSQELTSKLLKSHRPLTLADIDRNCRSAIGLFLILGYPRAGFEFIRQKWDEPHPHKPATDPLRYLCKRKADGWADDKLKYSDEIHIVVSMYTASLNANGEPADLPDHAGIEGISGCGIWLIADKRKQKPLSAYGPEDCKLVAIEHSYHEEAGRVAGTWVDLALDAIAINFPETKAAIDLVYP
jgi:hypothetical protein